VHSAANVQRKAHGHLIPSICMCGIRPCPGYLLFLVFFPPRTAADPPFPDPRLGIPEEPPWNHQRPPGTTPEPPLGREVKQAVASAPPAAGLGLDFCRPRDWAGLPDEAYDELAQLLNDMELSLSAPVQTLLLLMIFLEKPTGGERPIGLTSGLYRLHCKLRKWGTTQWEADKIKWWDTAVKGSDALQRGLRRLLKAEVCSVLDFPQATLLWDAEKFFDTISPEQVAAAGLQLGYPVVPLFFAMCTHTAARVLSSDGHHAEAFLPSSSILAGCQHSVAFTRLFLYELVDHLQAKWRPAELNVWVDDTTQRAHHRTEQRVVELMVGCASDFSAGLRAKGARVSKKCVTLASSPSMAREIQRRLRIEANLSIQVASSGRDLGIDFSCSKRRRTGIVRQRAAKAKRRMVKIAGMAKADRRAGPKLVATGAAPQARWGQQALGTSNKELLSIRVAMGSATGLKHRSGCLTTALAAALGPEQDPAVSYPVQLLQAFLRAYVALPSWHAAIAAAWQKLLPRIKGPTMWSRVFGHLGAVIATLRTAGWEPEQPCLWVDPAGDRWQIQPEAPHGVQVVGRHFSDFMVRRLWHQASTHHLGGGLAEGVSWPISLAGYKQLVRRTSTAAGTAASARAVQQGALWLETRRFERGMCESPLCRLCHQHRGDEAHLFWQCPAILALGLKAVADSDHLRAEAARGSESCPGFWLRGLVPQQWVDKIISEYPPHDFFVSFGLQGRLDLSRGSFFIGTDGSGGTFSQRPLLRRVGWGLVVFSSTPLDIIAWAGGGMSCACQTVPRAELRAVIGVAELTSGAAVVYVDSQVTIDGYKQGPLQMPKANLDLWGRLWAALADRPGRLHVKKVKSHTGVAELLAGQAPEAHLANNLADVVADKCAGMLQLPPAVVSDVDDLEKKARLVQARLFAIASHTLEHHPWPEAPGKVLRIGPAFSRAARAQWRLRRALRTTKHKVVFAGGGAKRSVCHRQASGRRLVRWLHAKYKGPALPFKLGLGHKLTTYRGVTYCKLCGGWGIWKSATLARVCLGKATRHCPGSRALKALQKGLAPQGLTHWPEGPP